MMSSNVDHSARRLRNRRSLFLAVVTSLFSKGGNILLQLLAMPLAYEALGSERFGIFGILQTVMWLIYMSDMGMGGGISRRFTLVTAHGNRREQTRVFCSGFFATLTLAAVFGLFLAAVLLVVPVERLFGEAFRHHSAELTLNLWLGLGIFLCMVMAGTFLRIREGCQELHVFNLFGAAGNIVAAVMLVVGIRGCPQVWFLLLALYGVQLATWTFNAVHVLWHRRWLVPRWAGVDFTLVRLLFLEGLAFFVVFSIAPVLEREGLRLLIGRDSGPEAVGLFSILTQLGFFILGFSIMLTAPLAPAITDAFSHRDFAWLKSLHRRVLAAGAVALVAIPGGLALLGPRFVDIWMRRDIPLGPVELAAYGTFFALALWSNVHCILLCACGFLRQAAMVAAVECAVVLAAGWAGLGRGGMTGALWAAAAGMAALSFWILPLLFRSRLAAEIAEASGRQKTCSPPEASVIAAPQTPSMQP